jgi:hypothetical protein
LDSDETIKNEFSKRGVTVENIKRHQSNIYTGEPYTLSPIEDISMRLIQYDDFDLVEKFFSERYPGRGSNSHRLKYLKHELHQRDVLGNTEHSIFMFGIFKGNCLIGVSDGGLQNTHGFIVNNCVATSVLREYETEELYQYAFKFVTNAALEKGALPIDDVQIPSTPDKSRSGAFNSTDLGYQTITNRCILK